jgi:Ca2+-binding EF-hand superfamily protein
VIFCHKTFKTVYSAGKDFENIDTNKDGKVGLKEFTDAGTERFKLFDKNQDGYLNNQEFYSKQAYPILKFYF